MLNKTYWSTLNGTWQMIVSLCSQITYSLQNNLFFFQVNDYTRSSSVLLDKCPTTIFFYMRWMTMNRCVSLAYALSTSSRRVCFFLCVFFFLPTQRGRLKWKDYSSHERQHNSRVTFEPYGDKKKKRKWLQSSAEVVQPGGGWGGWWECVRGGVGGGSTVTKTKMLLQ